MSNIRKTVSNIVIMKSLKQLINWILVFNECPKKIWTNIYVLLCIYFTIKVIGFFFNNRKVRITCETHVFEINKCQNIPRESYICAFCLEKTPTRTLECASLCKKKKNVANYLTNSLYLDCRFQFSSNPFKCIRLCIKTNKYYQTAI
jgi:hypothetical protein